MAKPLHEFKMHHAPYLVAQPCKDYPVANPLALLLCRYPLGSYLINPNFAIAHEQEFEYDEHTDPIYAFFTSSSEAPVARPIKPGAQTFWMKTYFENNGLL